METPVATNPVQRRACFVAGIVQGVGFRPFVHRLAVELGLAGFVRNEAGGVSLEVEGPPAALDRFAARLQSDAPPLARIESLRAAPLVPRGTAGFVIADSVAVPGCDAGIGVPADVATCAACLAELFDPEDRRFRYPFLNCTNCGPRLTIVASAPYDRARTTMAGFVMCADCRREFHDPADRRFHAQPIACPACGPRLRLVSRDGIEIPTADPLADFAAALSAGRIGALKGLGGYHLVCDAGSATAVALLRQRKGRDDKPFAVMVASVADAGRLCRLDRAEEELLSSPRRPIVLLRRQASSLKIDDGVAPEHPSLGIMLPYTPLHHLLLAAYDGRPLVMTSGNRSDEPIAYEDADAVERLGGIADLLLTHDRPIRVRCDDSVTRIVAGRPAPLRRSRGYAPESVPLPLSLAVPTLAVGGQLKATFALGAGGRAYVSQHLGDLEHLTAYEAFERDVRLCEDLFQIRPELLVHDLHPDYASTAYARRRARAEGVRLLAVQHHHAHVASVLAEHGLRGPVIGVAFDGSGYGTDGTIWGGEFLVADLAGFQRAARLRHCSLPGGDAAVREPWRVAAAQLLDAGCDPATLAARIPGAAWRTVQQMLARRFQTPLASSMGRLFDAVATLIGGRTHVTYEGQAAQELEWLATSSDADGSYPFDIVAEPSPVGECVEIDTRPLIRGVAADVASGHSAAQIARRFQTTVVEITADVCGRLREARGLRQVALSGGVFQNALLLSETIHRLSREGFDVYRPESVPANDGGLSLGQLAVAAASNPE